MSHSLFKQNYSNALKGISLESADVVDVSGDPVTADDIQLGIDQIDDDVAFIKANSVMTDAVAFTTAAAVEVPPAVGESFVATTNCLIADASKVCGGDIPPLKCDLDGAINQISLEELSDWFGVAGEAFAGSSEHFLARVVGIFGQQDLMVTQLLERLEQAKGMVASRTSQGGVAINLDRKACRALVWDGQYSPTPGAHLQIFSDITLALTEVVTDYHKRLLAFITSEPYALSKVEGNHLCGLVASVDLVERLRVLVENQEPPLLGNVKYVYDEDTAVPATGAYLYGRAPDADALIEELDLPESLKPEEMTSAIAVLEMVLTSQAQAIAAIIELCGTSFAAVNESVGEVSGETSPLSLQSKLIVSVADICKTQIVYQSDLLDRCAAVLAWVNESNIQDL